MTHYSDHEKRIREAVASGETFSDNDLRAILADLDAARAALSSHPSPEQAGVSDNDIRCLGQRNAWRYKCSSDPAHSSTYTFNDVCLLQFARAILALRPAQQAWADGVQAAADLLKRMADETALERGETDPDTGAIQFKSAATREWHASLCELAEEIERLKPAHHGITAPAGGEGK